MRLKEQLHKARYGTIYNFGGGSSSDSSQKSSTETTDNSIVGAPDSSNASLSHSDGNVINITDNGAVNDSFQAIQQVTSGATTLMSQALGTVSENSTAAVNAVNQSEANALNAVNAANTSALSAVSDAYSTAKAGEQKVLVAAALAILGIVAIKVVK